LTQTGTLIQSNIKIISIEKAGTQANGAVVYIYPADAGQIIRSIKYQDKNRLVCMYNNHIHMIENNTDTILTELSDKKIIFSDIKLDANYVKIYEKSAGLFADSQAQITNINNQKEASYEIKGLPRNLYVYGDNIAVNLGTEVHFISVSRMA